MVVRSCMLLLFTRTRPQGQDANTRGRSWQSKTARNSCQKQEILSGSGQAECFNQFSAERRGPGITGRQARSTSTSSRSKRPKGRFSRVHQTFYVGELKEHTTSNDGGRQGADATKDSLIVASPGTTPDLVSCTHAAVM